MHCGSGYRSTLRAGRHPRLQRSSGGSGRPGAVAPETLLGGRMNADDQARRSAFGPGVMYRGRGRVSADVAWTGWTTKRGHRRRYRHRVIRQTAGSCTMRNCPLYCSHHHSPEGRCSACLSTPIQPKVQSDEHHRPRLRPVRCAGPASTSGSWSYADDACDWPRGGGVSCPVSRRGI